MFHPEYSTARDQRVIKTRRALRDSLLTLLETSPFEDISVREIVDRAGIGYNTFFRHYADKQAMLTAVAEEEIAELVRISVPVLDSHDTLAACNAVCNYVAANKPLWKTLMTGGASAVLREAFIRIAREVAESRHEAKDWIPLDIAIVLVTSGIFELLAWWLAQEIPPSADRVASMMERAVVSPVIGGVTRR